MTRDSLYKDIDSYISHRRRKYGYPKAEKKPVVEKKAEPKPLPEDEYEEAIKKPGFFSRLFGKVDEEVIEEEVANDTDLHTLGQISIKLLRQLPAEQLREFKGTSDFIAFKEILQRNKVIK
jgi:hypothetical protein